MLLRETIIIFGITLADYAADNRNRRELPKCGGGVKTNIHKLHTHTNKQTNKQTNVAVAYVSWYLKVFYQITYILPRTSS